MAGAGADRFWPEPEPEPKPEPEPEPEMGYFSCKIFEFIMNRNFDKNLNIMFIFYY